MDFLLSQGVEKYSGSNAKMDPDHVQLVINKFKPELLSSSDKTLLPGINVASIDSEGPHAEGAVRQDFSDEKKSEQENILPESEKIEIIRAPKLKLQGVKVVGKIELPQKPAKINEIKTGEDILRKASKTDPTARGSKKSSNLKDHKSNRSLSFLEKQKREEQKREIEKKVWLKKEKAKKRIHYQKNVQSKILPAQSIKKQRSKGKRQESLNHRKITPTYKNPIKRFWAWLNGAYDQY